MHSLVHRMMHHWIFIWVIPLILLLSSLLILKNKVAKHNNKKLVPPPGPPKLPFFGHLHLIGSLPHRSFYNLSKQYGPVMLLKLGSVPTIVISSASAARDLFKLHDLASCSRAPLSSTRKLSYNYLDMAFSPYGEHWREVRKICVLELFSARRVQSFQPIREEEVGLLLNSISQFSSSSTLIDLSEKFYSFNANIITRVAFGKSFRGGELDHGNFHLIVRRAIVALGSFSTTDFFPRVGWIIDRLNGVHGSEVMPGNLSGMSNTLFDETVDDQDVVPETLPSEETQESDSTFRSRHCRGISTGAKLERNVTNHGILSVKFSQEYEKAVGPIASSFSKQIGVLVRGSFPVTLNKWKEVTPELKNLVKQRLLSHFNLDLSNPMVSKHIEDVMQTTFKAYRCSLHKHYKLLDPTIRRSNPHISITDPADWEYLCNRWEDPEFKSKSKKAEKSRSHVKYNHVAGSHSFLTIREQRKKGDQFIGSIDLFKETHCKEETGWVNPDCEEAYNKMIQIRATAIADGLPYDELEITDRILGMRGDMIKGLGKVPYEVRSTTRGKRVSSSSSSASMSSQRELQLQGQITELEKELALTREELQNTRDESRENYSQLREMMEQFRR